MKHLVWLWLMVLPGCSLVSWGQGGTPPPGAPRKSVEQVELERRFARLSSDLASEIVVQGTEPGSQEASTLQLVTVALNNILGGPLTPYELDPLPPKTLKEDIDRGRVLESDMRAAEARWKRELDTAKKELSHKTGLLDQLGMFIKWVVFVLVLGGGLVQALVCQFFSFPARTLRAVLYATVGIVGSVVWLLFAEKILFIGVIVALVVGLFFLAKSAVGDRVRREYSDTVAGIQEWRLAHAQDPLKDDLDLKLERAKKPPSFVDRVKEERGLSHTHESER
jgi:hypothetical protein